MCLRAGQLSHCQTPQGHGEGSLAKSLLKRDKRCSFLKLCHLPLDGFPGVSSWGSGGAKEAVQCCPLYVSHDVFWFSRQNSFQVQG